MYWREKIHMKKSRRILKILLILGVFIYTISTFITQQKALNSYQKEQEYYEDKIAEALEDKESLAKMKENIDSPEYIEKTAREKLDMYYPNERVYIDIGR